MNGKTGVYGLWRHAFLQHPRTAFLWQGGRNVHERKRESQALNLPVRSGQDAAMPDTAGLDATATGGVEGACHTFPSFNALLLRELEALFAGAVVLPAIAARYLIAAARAAACTSPQGLAVAEGAVAPLAGPLACPAEPLAPSPGTPGRGASASGRAGCCPAVTGPPPTPPPPRPAHPPPPPPAPAPPPAPPPHPPHRPPAPPPHH